MLNNYNLIPEKALLEALPKHIQRRFERALLLMHDNLAQQLTWEQIAWQSSISPAHFHRQFKALFHETPGHYLSRVRLQFATQLLLTSPQKRITDIAHLAGFSETQALAKALKRTLGVTATTIKQMAENATPRQTADLLATLSQPFAQGKLEQALAQQIPAELIWVAKRSGCLLTVESADWEYLMEQFDSDCSNLIVLTPVRHLDRPWQNIDSLVCNQQTTALNHNIVIAEGYYLSAVVTLNSAISYFAAFDALFDIARQRGLSIDPSGQVTEQLLDYYDEEGATFLLQLPISA